ncbi:MAG: hypothetical protein QM784_21970 [Polyangiaceae bacterium]
MNQIAELVSELAANREDRVLVAIAAYPRFGWTGELERIGQVVSRTLALLPEDGDRSFRVMHNQGVVLMRARGDILLRIQDVNATCSVQEVEVRALIAQFTGGRDADWLDELLGDLSVRGNFGRFSMEPVVRLIDGIAVNPARP